MQVWKYRRSTIRSAIIIRCYSWAGRELHRVYECLLHVDIREGKVWIQEDRTEVGLACELMELGVPKDDIVLAFHAPYKRPYTGFAVGQ